MKKRKNLEGGSIRKLRYPIILILTLGIGILLCNNYNKEKILKEEPQENILAIYLEDKPINYIPEKDSGYTLDLDKSSCTNGVTLDFDESNWSIKTNFTNYTQNNTRVKCNLYFKIKDVTVSFISPNILPDYENDKWLYDKTVPASVKVDSYSYMTTSMHFQTHPSYLTNAFYFILMDSNQTSILENIVSFGANTTNKDIIYEFPYDTGWYSLQSRLNGSDKDFLYYTDFYFTKGKQYRIQGDVKVSADKLTWDVENLAIYEEIPSVTIKAFETVSKPNVEIFKPGYTVGEKWYTDYNRTQEFDFNTPLTDDIALYAGITKQ